MQKREKHGKNQCFCYHKTTKISPKTGPKTKKIRLRARPPAEPQKKMLQTQKLVKKLKNTGLFYFSLADFGRARSCLPYCFLQCFLKASITTYQKQEVLAEKWDPPPGKPVTFYECHPDDHAPAPSVRADFYMKMYRVRLMFHDSVNSLKMLYFQ